jgi:hypothetical protein
MALCVKWSVERRGARRWEGGRRGSSATGAVGAAPSATRDVHMMLVARAIKHL